MITPAQARASLNVLNAAFVIPILSLTLIQNASASENTLFIQPFLPGPAGYFCVRCNFPPGTFNVVQWEDNPSTFNHNDVLSIWDSSEMTGFTSHVSPLTTQLNFRRSGPSTGVQICRNVVGAYLNSRDASSTTPGQKLIITPNIRFATRVQPFDVTDSSKSVEVSFDLQVPVASDSGTSASAAYVVSDLTFFDKTTGRSISVNQTVFRNGAKKPGDFVFYDADSDVTVAIGDNLGHSKFSKAEYSEPLQSRPWLGWKHFGYTVGFSNLKAAIKSIKARYPNSIISETPESWLLTQWHLNAEILFKDGPAEMGWSLKNTTISLFRP